MLNEVGPVEIDVPRDRVGSFDPKIVKKRQRRLMASTRSCYLSLPAGSRRVRSRRTSTTSMGRQCKDTISRITDKVIER